MGMQQKSLIWGMRWSCSGASVFSLGSGLIDDGERAKINSRWPGGAMWSGTKDILSLSRYTTRCNMHRTVARDEEQVEGIQEDGACRDGKRGYDGSLWLASSNRSQGRR